jgi:hypothetical protein
MYKVFPMMESIFLLLKRPIKNFNEKRPSVDTDSKKTLNNGRKNRANTTSIPKIAVHKNNALVHPAGVLSFNYLPSGTLL